MGGNFGETGTDPQGGGRLAAAAARVKAQHLATQAQNEEKSFDPNSAAPLAHRLQHLHVRMSQQLATIDEAIDILAKHPEVEETLRLMDLVAALGLR